VANNELEIEDFLPNTTMKEVTGSLIEGETWETIRDNAMTLLNEDDTVWSAAVIIGYVTSALYLLLFTWFILYQCTCCIGDDLAGYEDNGELKP
jgi:hypothetical protein